MKDRAKSRADMIGSSFVSDAEWTAFVNASAFELWDILSQKFGENWSFQRTTLQTTIGNEAIQLPAAVYRMLSVQRLDAGKWLPLDRISFSGVTEEEQDTGKPCKYMLAGNTVTLAPIPDSAYTIRLTFIPEMTSLSADSDVMPSFAGWEEYVVVDAAIKALSKEESDVAALMAEKAALVQRITSAAERRDAGAPAQVIDVEKVRGDYGPFSLWEL